MYVHVCKLYGWLLLTTVMAIAGVNAWRTQATHGDLDTPLYVSTGGIHYHHLGNQSRMVARGPDSDCSLGMGCGGGRGADHHRHHGNR